MIRVKRLEISGLRGLPRNWPPVNVKPRGLVIYGPNGSGKSSIVDGIEHSLKGASSLFSDNRAGVNWERASEHVKGGPRTASVICDVNGAEHNINGTELPSDEAHKWKELAARSNFVLRRHMLLKFISSQPATRYEQLEPFFDVSAFAKIELAMMNVASGLNAKLVEQEVALTRLKQRLRLTVGLQPSDPISATAVDAKLVSALKGCGLPEDLTPNALVTRKHEISQEMKGFAADKRLTELSSLRKRLSDLVPSATYQIMLTQLLEAQSAMRKAASERTETVPSDFLRTGRRLIEDRGSAACPLCESEIEPVVVLERLASRIGSDEKFTALLKSWDSLRVGVLTPISLHHRELKLAVDAWPKLLKEELPKAYADELVLLSALIQKLGTKQPIDDLEEIIAALKATISDHAPRIEVIDAAVAEGGGERRAALNEVLAMIEVKEIDLAKYTAAQRELVRVQKRHRLAERVHGHAVQARKETVQEIIAGLATLANEYYEFLHPGENISKARLDIRTAGSASIDIKTEFSGSVEHPMLHFSESHLDTLGLCFFLAARRLESQREPGFKLLVLDDVIHSVDAEHRERVARLLTEKFQDHQIIVVTHDTIFYQRLRHHLGGQFEYLYFSSWSLEAGPVRTTSSTDVDRVTVKEVREKLTAEELAASAGRFFEFLLRLVTERLNIAIPARFSRPHDIGNMWPSLYSKIKKSKNSSEDLKKVAEDLNDSQWIRNQVGAHYNEPASPVSDKEVQRLAEGLTTFYELVFCTNCRVSVEKKKDDDWRCQCEALCYS